MENNFNTPNQVVDTYIQTGIKKATQPYLRMILLGILAGMFIAIGAEGSNLAVHGISNAGLAKALAGAIFPVGLMMIVLIGGDLFTGNCLVGMSVFDKKLPVYKMIINLIVIFFTNMIGALFVVFAVYYSGQFDTSNGGLGAYSIKVALGKVNISPEKAIISGIMCNVLVCVAILMAMAARDIAGKCIAIFFPIAVFVISGFEHCVANMYYIPAGIIASKNDVYANKAMELYGISKESLNELTIGGMIHNLIPVTIGNMIGGIFLVGGLTYLIYKNKFVNKESK